jgi:hypothetical protein
MTRRAGHQISLRINASAETVHMDSAANLTGHLSDYTTYRELRRGQPFDSRGLTSTLVPTE